MKRNSARAGAVTAAAALTMLSAAPAHAATVSQSSATALTISVAGNGADSGTVKATHDGTSEAKTGQTNPPVAVLGNQNLLNAGVLAQEATAQVDEAGAGWSSACAGVAGEGGSVAQVGDSSCLNPGQPVDVSIANLDLTGTVLVDPESALSDLAALQPVIDDLVGPLTKAISEGLAPLGETGLGGTFGAVAAQCVATPGEAQGSATLVDAQLALSLGGDSVDVVNLPVHPAPNTEVLVDLDEVTSAVLEALREDLNTTLDGSLAPLSAVIDPVQEQIVDTLIAEIAPQLAPLSENVLRIMLNEQSTTDDGIEVTAMHIELLPAAEQFDAETLVDARLGTVTCGPNGEVAPVSVQQPGDPQPVDDGEELPAVPTVVASGAHGTGDGSTGFGALALGTLALVAGVAGVVGLRRSLSR